MKLYLIRHANPNVDEYAGFPGPELGALGKKQAERIAVFLKSKNIQKVFSSDYTRVLQTLSPFQKENPSIKVEMALALRERENKTETHNSLVRRVENWLIEILPQLNSATVIFSHCGPINMILDYLDRGQKLMDYPFCCQYLCLTHKGGIWDLDIEDNKLISGELLNVNSVE